jgi:hypothetical protein
VNRAPVAATVLLLCLQALAACGAGSGDPRGEQGVGQAVQILTSPETSSYREAIARSEGAVARWIEPGQAGGKLQESAEARKAVAEAIKSAASRLAAVDYASLSLPDFVTQTRALKLEPALFTGQGLGVDAYGEGTNSTSGWALYSWQGPEFPKRPDRPLVYRWIHVYALYSFDRKAVTRLLATIHGEAIE